ncbi:MAG: chitinase [Lachnospiraceae bacterium]|nr:chitinase [Lachnospiraceae bacterium]
MKKIIPVFVAIVLIAVIGWLTFGKKVAEKYTYSDERADLYEYFHIIKEEEVPIILQDALVEEDAILVDNVCYFDLDTVHKYFNDRFYVDRVEGLLLYTTPTEIIRTVLGSSVYSVDGMETDAGYTLSFSRIVGEDTIYYIAADFVKQYTNYSYEVFAQPNRMQVYTQWDQRTVADVRSDNAVRVLGGVKSPILTDVAAGDTLVVLDKMETWCEVKTQDGFIGYIENKVLENERKETPSAVTDYEVPEYTSLTKDKKIALGWHAVYGKSGNDTLGEVVADAPGMNVIAPTWFSLSDNAGNFASFGTKTYVDKAHEMGLEVWGVVDNFNYAANNKPNNIDTKTVLSATTARTTLIQNLINKALELGLDGINIDFEKIDASFGQDYVQFLRELSIQCRAKELIFSVDVPVPFNYNAHYDIAEQGVVADYVIIMGYDEHGGDSSVAGSVASLGYVTQGLDIAVSQMPSNKIVNALPFYTRLWTTEGTKVKSRAYGLSAVKGLLKEYGMEPSWDETAGQYYAEKKTDKALYQIWIEDTQSILAKINVMQKYDLGGVAAWRLGFETDGVWDAISAYIGN